MRRFLFLSPFHDFLRRRKSSRSARVRGSSRAASWPLMLFSNVPLAVGKVVRLITLNKWRNWQFWDHGGENVNRVNLCISATWRQASASTFVNESLYCDGLTRFCEEKYFLPVRPLNFTLKYYLQTLLGRNVIFLAIYIHQNWSSTTVNVVDFGRQFRLLVKTSSIFIGCIKHLKKIDQAQLIWGVFDNLIGFVGRRFSFLFPSPSSPLPSSAYYQYSNFYLLPK